MSTPETRDHSVRNDRLAALASDFLELRDAESRESFASGRKWWWQRWLWHRGWISLPAPDEARRRKTNQAACEFVKGLNEVLKAQVAAEVKAQLAGREVRDGGS